MSHSATRIRIRITRVPTANRRLWIWEILWTMRWRNRQPRPLDLNLTKLDQSYLIFVISFTQASCVVEIFYTRNAWFFCVKRAKIGQTLCVKSYAVCKLPIQCLITPWKYTVLNIGRKHFHVQLGQFYTWQKTYTQAPPVVPVTNMRYAWPKLDHTNQLTSPSTTFLASLDALIVQSKSPVRPIHL